MQRRDGYADLIGRNSGFVRLEFFAWGIVCVDVHPFAERLCHAMRYSVLSARISF